MKDYFTIKELPEDERPYEKFEQFGAENLTDAELLAIIIRTGRKGLSSLNLAREILGRAGDEGLLGICKLHTTELKKIDGVGRVKAIQIKAVAELSRRIAKRQAGTRLRFQDSAVVARYYMEDMRHLNQEEMHLIMLNTRCECIGEQVISRGTVSTSVTSPREIFLEAFKREAVYIMLLHNHPSGDPTPSKKDIELTDRISEVGNLLCLRLLDHIIIGDNRYVSMRELGHIS